jgi:hypothetical protein
MPAFAGMTKKNKASSLSAIILCTRIDAVPPPHQRPREQVSQHSEHIVLHLSKERGGTVLCVEDDGQAQKPPSCWGNGLLGMQERVRSLGGTLQIAVQARHGLQVRAWVPQFDPTGTGL